jgi:hypothetical protein
MFQDNITIILQGIISDEVDIFTILKLYTQYANIILSIYDTPSQKIVGKKIIETYSSVIIVYNSLDSFKKEYFDRANTDVEPTNTFYQIKTTLNGIDKSKTEYIVKTRVDHFYSNIYDFMQTGITTNKIVISSNWVRNYRYRFHASDCLIMTKGDILRNIFLDAENTFYNRNYTNIPEIDIWKQYLQNKVSNNMIDIVSDDKYITFMTDTFLIFNIVNHKEYRLKTSWGGVITKILEDENKSDTDFWRIGCVCGHLDNKKCSGCPFPT